MDLSLFERLYREGLVSDESLDKIRERATVDTVNVHRELTTMLYVGILLLTAGLGILVYKNIDSIGHLAIICFIAIACAACFAYCIKKARGFSYYKVQSPNHLFDYVLLLACLLLLTLVGYLQFQYVIFGDRWGMAIFFPMIVLFISAYYFDHIGVLSLAITNLAAWAGITITPLQLLAHNDFSAFRIIYTGILLGAVLVGMGLLSTARNSKRHFSFTYKNFGIHLLFVALIAAMVQSGMIYLLWFVVIAGVTWYFFVTASKERSFYFLVISTLYFYIAMSYVIIHGLFEISHGEGMIYLTLFYLIFSAIGLIIFLINQNKRLKNVGLS